MSYIQFTNNAGNPLFLNNRQKLNPKDKKSQSKWTPKLAVSYAASTLIPGSGQLIMGDYIKGILHFAIATSLIIVNAKQTMKNVVPRKLSDYFKAKVGIENLVLTLIYTALSTYSGNEVMKYSERTKLNKTA